MKADRQRHEQTLRIPQNTHNKWFAHGRQHGRTRKSHRLYALMSSRYIWAASGLAGEAGLGSVSRLWRRVRNAKSQREIQKSAANATVDKSEALEFVQCVTNLSRANFENLDRCENAGYSVDWFPRGREHVEAQRAVRVD